MKLYLERAKDRPAIDVPLLASDIEQWAEHSDFGNLSKESAHAFASWLEDDVHTNGEYENTLTVGELLRLCLERWIGGRPI